MRNVSIFSHNVHGLNYRLRKWGSDRRIAYVDHGCGERGRVDDFSFFDCSSSLCFLLIVFRYTFTIQYCTLYFFIKYCNIMFIIIVF